MAAFGERLRREREMRGVSLDDIAQATKIGTRLLRALEDEQFDLLPGGIFNKGFVRAYAKYLGINEEQAVADYLQAAGDTDPDVRVIAEQNARGDYGYLSESDNVTRSGFPLLPVVILLLVVAGGFGGWKIYQDRVAERERSEEAATKVPAAQSAPSAAPTAEQPTVTSSNAAAGGTSPAPGARSTGGSAVGTASTAGPTTPLAVSPANTAGTNPSVAAGTPFEVTVKTNDRAWVSIKSDGQIAVRGVIEGDQVKTVRGANEIVLWTGNAGVTQVAFNGKNIPVEGGINDVRILVFNSSGLVRQSAPPPPQPKPAAQTVPLEQKPESQAPTEPQPTERPTVQPQ